MQSVQDFVELLGIAGYHPDAPETQQLAQRMVDTEQHKRLAPQSPAECPACNGRGTTLVWVTRTTAPYPIGEVDCAACDGTGEVW